MNTLFDSAGLAIVAFMDVASDGSIENGLTSNAGVLTTKLSTGVYRLTLPSQSSGPSAGPNLAQPIGTDLIFVQCQGVPGNSAIVDEFSATQKNIVLSNGATLTDGEFTVLILRTLLSPLVP